MKNIIKRIVLLIITFIFLFFIFKNLDLVELKNVMKMFNIIYVIPLGCSILIALALRGLVFRELLNNKVKAPLIELSYLCITTAGLNIVLPARAGDIFRAFYIGHKFNLDKVKVFGTVMFERIFDIIVIFSLLLIGVCIYHRNPIAVNLCLFAGIFMVIGLVLAIYSYKYNKTDVICRFLIKKTSKFPFANVIKNLIMFINKSCNSFFDGFEVIESPKNMFCAIMTSFIIWFFECMNFYIVMKGFGCEIHWSVTLFLISFIALACMVPSTSIFIGPYQMAVITAFNMYNVEKETALAISIVEQAVVLILTSFIAFTFLIKHNISLKELKISEKKF